MNGVIEIFLSLWLLLAGPGLTGLAQLGAVKLQVYLPKWKGGWIPIGRGPPD